MNEIHRGDIFWYTYENHYNNEQTGNRPCIIVSNEKANRYSPIITIVPLTSKKKKRLPTHAIIESNKGNTALCEQVISISRDRFTSKIGHCNEEEMKAIENCLKIQLSMECQQQISPTVSNCSPTDSADSSSVQENQTADS